jgi:hypothetical protein
MPDKQALGLDWKKLEASVGGAGKLYAGRLQPPFQEELWLLLSESQRAHPPYAPAPNTAELPVRPEL